MKTTENIEAVLEHIYARVRDKINPSLTQITALLADIGNPQFNYPTYHLIGTNGKGSSARMLSALLEREGLRTGLYSSPHLVSATERIICDNHPIPEDQFLAIWEDLRATAERWDATFFEVFTAMAFVHFKQQRVEVAVIEAGMGGTWDATSVIQPEVVILTAVHLDHTGRLGTTREAIARDKAGAMKEGVPFICGERDPELRKILQAEAERRGALFQLPEDFVTLDIISETPLQTRLRVHFAGSEREVEVLIPLSGKYQVDNFQCALAAFCSAHQREPEGEMLDLTEWSWPGRLDQVCKSPLTVIDTAHNPDAARALFAALESVYPGLQPVVLYGTFGDKEWQGYLQVIAKHTDRIHPLVIPFRRGLAAAELEQGVRELFPDAPAPAEFVQAWEQARADWKPDQLLVVCGSFHVAEAAYRQLNLEPFSRRKLVE
jgi:dihydrofolate synthase / folylpolyglutamate synthase